MLDQACGVGSTCLWSSNEAGVGCGCTERPWLQGSGWPRLQCPGTGTFAAVLEMFVRHEHLWGSCGVKIWGVGTCGEVTTLGLGCAEGGRVEAWSWSGLQPLLLRVLQEQLTPWGAAAGMAFGYLHGKSCEALGGADH